MSADPGPNPSAADTALPPDWWRRRRDQASYAHAVDRLRTPMTVLALVFTGGLLAELAWEVSGPTLVLVRIGNLAIWAAFAAEYLWLLRLAPDRGRFVRTHVLDLIVVLLPVLRPLRALRLVRVLAVALRSWHQVFSVLRHRGLGKIISSVGALMIVGGLITFVLEPQTFPTVADAVWWVLVTSTTVGYGDFAPVGHAGRLVATIIMLLGIGLVGVITANIVDFMSQEPATGTDPDPAGQPAAGPNQALAAPCQTCADTTARLARIETQLEALLGHLGPAGPAPPPASS